MSKVQNYTAPKRVLLACYGGGHVQSLIPIVKRMAQQQAYEVVVIGFTTARAAFERADIEVVGYSCLLDESDNEWLEFAAIYAPKDSHPDVSESETLAYYAIGLRDLVLVNGKEKALELFLELGRKVFLPENSFKRYLEKLAPHLVVTSSSPRSELALQRAATSLGIKTLAISDLFLQYESRYICADGYAENITVMAGYVAKHLEKNGYKGTIHITGNPAFDNLNDINTDERDRIKEKLGIAVDERPILWVCPSAPVSMMGKPFVKTSEMLSFLDNFCSRNNGFRYIVRQHPNNPVIEHSLSEKGVLCPTLMPIEDCLNIADRVLLETSTVGLQAALLDLPAVTIDAGNYPPYAQLGLSMDISTLEEAEQALLEVERPRLDLLSYPALGCATDQVLEVIYSLLN